MDDRDLGALLDASVPTATASDEALSRIRRRAGQRRRRAAIAASALTVLVAVGAALGISAIASSTDGGSITPATQHNPVPGGSCPRGSITLTIDPEPVETNGTVRWAITGVARVDSLCRTYGLDAAIEKPDGTVLTSIPGNPAVQNDRFQDLFPPGRTQFVDYLSWSNPCSDGPVALVVSYHDNMSGDGARLTLPKQTCTANPARAAYFQIEPPGAARTDETSCPRGSIRLAIEPVAVARGSSSQANSASWVVTGTTSAEVACQAHPVIDATIENSERRLISGVPGNPVQRTLQTVLTPLNWRVVAAVSWLNPCSDKAVRIVVRLHGEASGPAAVLDLPKQPCANGPISTSHFAVDVVEGAAAKVTPSAATTP